MSLQEPLNIFLISEGCFFLSPSHDTVLAFISSAENSNSNWFPLLCKIPLIRTEISTFLGMQSSNCWPAKLTMCEAVMMLYLLYLAKEERKADVLETVFTAGQNFCCQTEISRWESGPPRDTQEQAGWSAPAPTEPCIRHPMIPHELVGERHDRKVMPLLNEFPPKP